MLIDFNAVKDKALNDEFLTRDECIAILNIKNDADFQRLLDITYDVRKKFKSNFCK